MDEIAVAKLTNEVLIVIEHNGILSKSKRNTFIGDRFVCSVRYINDNESDDSYPHALEARKRSEWTQGT